MLTLYFRDLKKRIYRASTRRHVMRMRTTKPILRLCTRCHTTGRLGSTDSRIDIESTTSPTTSQRTRRMSRWTVPRKSFRQVVRMAYETCSCRVYRVTSRTL